MKKRCFSLIFALLLAMALAVPAAAGVRVQQPASAAEGAEQWVIDEAGLLDEEQEQKLAAMASKCADEYGCALYVVTVEDYLAYGFDPMDAAINIYTDNALGCGPEQNGLLLMLSMAARDYQLICNGGQASRVFSQSNQKALAEEFLPFFADNDWYGGFSRYLEDSAQLLKMDSKGKTPVLRDTGKDLIVLVSAVLVVPAVVAAGICLVLKSKMKTVRAGSQASGYMQNDPQLRVREDVFTHTTQVRRRIEQPRSSGSSVGSSSSRGGFSGTGGKF